MCMDCADTKLMRPVTGTVQKHAPSTCAPPSTAATQQRHSSDSARRTRGRSISRRGILRGKEGTPKNWKKNTTFREGNPMDDHVFFAARNSCFARNSCSGPSVDGWTRCTLHPAREGGKSSPSATTRAGGALRLRRGGPEQVCHRACARSRACVGMGWDGMGCRERAEQTVPVGRNFLKVRTNFRRFLK